MQVASTSLHPQVAFPLCGSVSFSLPKRTPVILDYGFAGGMQLSPEGEGRPRWKAGWQLSRLLFPWLMGQERGAGRGLGDAPVLATHPHGGEPSPAEGKVAVPGPGECAVDAEPEPQSSAASETEKHISDPRRGSAVTAETFTTASLTAAESQKPAACMWWGVTGHGRGSFVRSTDVS